MSISFALRCPLQKLLVQFYNITILIFGLSERDGLILDQCSVRGEEQFCSSECQFDRATRSRDGDFSKFFSLHIGIIHILRKFWKIRVEALDDNN